MVVELQVAKEPIYLNDDDVLVVRHDQSEMYQKCCDCGLVHRVEILSERTGDLRLRFVRIGSDFPPDMQAVTYVEAEGG